MSGPVPGPALDLDAALREADEDRRVAGLMRQARNAASLRRRAETIEALVAEVKRQRAGNEPDELSQQMIEDAGLSEWRALRILELERELECAQTALSEAFAEADDERDRLAVERAAARAALARVQGLHCECTTGNCACGGGPGWCHGCDESWPCSTARALAEMGEHCPSCHRPLPHNEVEQRACGAGRQRLVRPEVPPPDPGVRACCGDTHFGDGCDLDAEPGEQPKETER